MRELNSDNTHQSVLGSWFKIRGRKYHSGIAFVAHRIAGFILVAYFVLHMLQFPYSLTIGFKIVPVIVFIATFHALNGIRLVLNEIGVGYRYRQVMVIATIILTVAISGTFVLYAL